MRVSQVENPDFKSGSDSTFQNSTMKERYLIGWIKLGYRFYIEAEAEGLNLQLGFDSV